MNHLAILALAVGVTFGCSEERPRPDANPTGRLHAPGILDPADDDWHGHLLAREAYDFEQCAQCHGQDLGGGAAPSCRTCHTDGPTTCATCHRGDTEGDAHPIHRAAGVGCAECHVVPAAWDAEGHVRRDGELDAPPAEVTFGALAALPTPQRQGPPTFDGGRCANVYCHGDALPPSGGINLRPAWDATPVQACDRCHGGPPPDHAPYPPAQCRGCHPGAHIDGTLQVGGPACDSCHGGAGDPAPPVDLSGNQFTTALGVGAHQAHLDGPSRLRGPIPCSTCHLVPLAVDTPGHIDTLQPAEVIAEIGWDRTAQTCGAWCHATASSPTLSPPWTAGGGAVCGACHGVPPPTPSHAGVTSLPQCVSCHARSIDMFGNFLFTTGPDGPVSEHIDGTVDVF